MWVSRPMRKIRHEQCGTLVRRRPSLDFSMTGLVYASMMLFMGLAAVNSQANLLFGVFGLMIGVLMVSFLISRLVLHKVQVRRIIPETSTVGSPMVMHYAFTNDKRFWPSLSVGFAELEGSEAFVAQPVAYMLHAAPRTTTTVAAEVIPKRRGRHRLERYQVATSFPFGFIKRATIRREIDEMTVHPASAMVDRKVLQLARAAEKAGPTVRPRRGGLDEFYGVRQYRAGDSPRWIHWRRSAHSGSLVTREMTRATPPRLVLLVDTHLPDRSPASHAAVERAIAMAASLVNFAAEADLLVGLLCWNGHWARIDPQRGKRRRRDLLAVLSDLPLNTAHDFQELLDESRDVTRADTTGIILTPRDVQMGLGERARGSLVALSSVSEQSNRWFRFDPGIDFSHTMPADQDPALSTRKGDPDRV